MSAFIENRYAKIKPYLFLYKNGFCVLPYINTSPQLMWQIIRKMSFIKFNSFLNMAESDNAYLYYQELEEELVMFYTQIDYKKRTL